MRMDFVHRNLKRNKNKLILGSNTLLFVTCTTKNENKNPKEGEI